MQGAEQTDGAVSVTSMDDNLLDGGDEWADPEEMAPDDSETEGYDSGGYEFVGWASDEEFNSDSGDSGGLFDDAAAAAETGLLLNPVTAPAVVGWNAAGEASSWATDGEVRMGGEVSEETEETIGGVVDETADAAGDAASNAGDALTPDLPGWAPYAAAGVGVLVLLLVLSPYAKLGAEVAG
jgi:hypothetical protein